MEREIKFEVRIEHIQTGNTWTEIFSLDQLLNRNGCLYSPGIQKVVYKRQFTGLKDKNGREICEGDVILWGSDKGEVVFDEVHWAVKIKLLRFPQTFPAFLAKSFEIIGNIHENPELL